VNPGQGDYRLSPSSPYKAAATDGKDVGVDLGETFARSEAAATNREPHP
jgi:hypothetical protein